MAECGVVDPILDLRNFLDEAQRFSWPGRFVAALRQAPRLIRDWAAIRRLPHLSVRVIDDRTGRDIAGAMRSRSHLHIRHSVAAGVLALPEDPESYAKGRSRQAMRTNSTRARAVGITCRVPSWTELPDLLDTFFASRPELASSHRWLREQVGEQRGRVFFAESADGEPLALLVALVAGPTALLSMMFSLDRPERAPARYLLSQESYTALARDGVRHVISGSSLAIEAGDVYFQRRLGFAACHVSVVLEPADEDAH